MRYLSNYSSGELGFEICRALEKRSNVIAVVGPCSAPFDKLKFTTLYRVETVDEMYKTVMRICSQKNPDFAILSAAVLDFAPKKIESGKVSSKRSWSIDLVPTPKIIDEITRRFPRIKKVAFKLEWKASAPSKIKSLGKKVMEEKSAEGLCLNFLSQIGAKNHPAFLFTRDGLVKKAKSKKEIARWISRFVLSNE